MSATKVASPAAGGVVPLDPVRALQHTLYRTAKADSGRRFHALGDKIIAVMSSGVRGFRCTAIRVRLVLIAPPWSRSRSTG